MGNEDFNGERGRGGQVDNANVSLAEKASVNIPPEGLNLPISETTMEPVSAVLAIQSLLSQFMHPRVRADFVNGSFNVVVSKEDVQLIDELRWKLFPQWMGGSLDGRSERMKYAKTNLIKLINRSGEPFSMECLESNNMNMSYGQIHGFLDRIAADNYWANVPVYRRCTHVVYESELPGTEDGVERKAVKVEQSGSSSDSRTKRSKNKSVRRKSRTKLEDIIVLSSDSDSSSTSQSKRVSACSSSSSSTESGYRKTRSAVSRSFRMKEVVTPPVFEMDGKTSLNEFLDHFERYFYATFQGNGNDMTQKLSEFLTGDMKKVFEVKGGRRLKYSEMRDVLLKFYRGRKIGGRSHWKEQLNDIKMNSDESYEIFGMRLSDLVQRAFPKDSKEAAKQLRNRFLSALPSSIVNKVCDAERTLKATTRGKSKRLPFSELTRIAMDMEGDRTKRSVLWSEKEMSENKCEHCDSNGLQSSGRSGTREYRSRVRFRDSDSVPRRTASTFQRGRVDEVEAVDRCSYCKRTNHIRRNCWRANGACLICGRNHAMVNCPMYDPQFRNRSPNNVPALNSQVSVEARTVRD